MSKLQVSHDAIEIALQRVEIFKSVPGPVIHELAGKVIISDLKENEKIISQGEEGSSMYFILSGEVKVHDRQYVIANLGAESFFGEFSLLDNEPRSLSVTTVVPSVVGCIQQVDFFSVLNKNPEITRDIIRVMLQRLRNQNQKIINQLREKQKELEELVRLRTLDLHNKNTDLENTLANLKRTQEQLVQQAKLASLGQITAGIAHEIQNPLNFINNFSALSSELADEILATADETEKLEILSDLKMNLSKIESHGKRADSIVKGMLLHSKSSKGMKQATDIVSLCDQSLGLAYNSISESFPDLKCEIERNFEDKLPEIHLVPQDISRVIINILNNSFYALNEKAKGNDNQQLRLDINVCRSGEMISISIRDNGIGIPDTSRDKIFQPFFTTKPTGQGTGLGLSSGYEIIKAHGGNIKFDSAENEYCRFIVELPVA